jgi:hypothetical protein
MYVEKLERLTIWKRGSIFYATYDSKLNTWSTKLFIDPRFYNREIALYSLCPRLKNVEEAVTDTNVGGKRLCNPMKPVHLTHVCSSMLLGTSAPAECPLTDRLLFFIFYSQ